MMDELMKLKRGEEELASYAGEEKSHYGGCTATTAIITKDEIYCANAGDSRTVLSVNGKAENLSDDHKPDNLEEKKRIQNAGCYVEGGRVNSTLAVSRALGDFDYKRHPSFNAKFQAVTAFPDVTVIKREPEH